LNGFELQVHEPDTLMSIHTNENYIHLFVFAFYCRAGQFVGACSWSEWVV